MHVHSGQYQIFHWCEKQVKWTHLFVYRCINGYDSTNLNINERKNKFYIVNNDVSLLAV